MKACALCKSKKPLHWSHIVPEFMYREMYDPKHRFFGLSRTKHEGVRLFQKGLREKLLCADCEALLSKYEHYAADVFFGNGQQLLKGYRDGSQIILEGLDYHRLKLFFLSLLWRLGVTSLSEFKGAELGTRHLERLRKMIHGESPGEEMEYPCWLTAITHNGKHLGAFRRLHHSADGCKA
jgi:hypothetical protein